VTEKEAEKEAVHARNQKAAREEKKEIEVMPGS
jgi:hypothetical protein